MWPACGFSYIASAPAASSAFSIFWLTSERHDATPLRGAAFLCSPGLLRPRAGAPPRALERGGRREAKRAEDSRQASPDACPAGAEGRASQRAIRLDGAASPGLTSGVCPNESRLYKEVSMTASPRRLYLTVLVTACLLVLSTGVSPGPRGAQTKAPPPPEGSQKTLAAAKAFIESAEKRLLELGVASDRADWVQQNFITEDTEQMAAVAKINL